MARENKRAPSSEWRSRKSPYPGVYPSGPDSWQYRLRGPKDPLTGKREQVARGGYATDKEAHEARVRHQTRILDGMHTRRADEDIMLEEFLDYWLQVRRDLSGSSVYNYTWAIESWIKPYIGKIKLRSLTVDIVSDWFGQIAEAPSARDDTKLALTHKSANYVRTVLVTALSKAQEERRIALNPAALVRPYRVVKKKVEPWDDEEIVRFLEVLHGDPDAAYWRLMLLGQMRIGEVDALKWPVVDLRAGRVKVERTRTRDAVGNIVLGESAKSVAGERWIELPDVCVLDLRRIKRKQDEERLRSGLGDDWNPHQWVFPGRQWKMRSSPGTMRGRLHALCDKAKVRPLSPHGLRHTGATWMARNGVSPATISKRLGHKRVEFTMNEYVNPGRAEDRDAADRLNNPPVIGKQRYEDDDGTAIDAAVN